MKCAPGIGPSCYQDNDDRARRYGVAEKRDCHFVGEPISHDAGADDGADEDGGAPGFGGEAAFEIERPASACLGRVQSLLQRELVGAGHRQAGEDQDAVCLGKRKMPLGLAAAGGGWIRYRGDGKSYTIKLRTGIKFHDNSDMTSEDVVASLTRWTKIASRGKQAAGFRLQASGFIEAIAAVDPATVKITLRQPYAPLTSLLALRPNVRSSVAPAKPDSAIENANTRIRRLLPAGTSHHHMEPSDCVDPIEKCAATGERQHIQSYPIVCHQYVTCCIYLFARSEAAKGFHHAQEGSSYFPSRFIGCSF